MRLLRLGVVPLTALTAISFSACGGGAPSSTSETTAVVDVEGDTAHLTLPVERMISLVPSATATLRVLGVDSVLAGRTDYDEGEWLADIPSVGGGLEPSLEALVALDPDVVVRFAGEQDPTTPARLDDLGIPHVGVRPERIEDVYTMTTLLGRLTGADADAEALVARLRAGLDSVRIAAEGEPSLRVAYVLGGTPPWVSGPGTYIHELIELTGGVNVFADLGSAYAGVSPEEFVARRIDVILTNEPARFDRSLAPDARVIAPPPEMDLPGPALVDTARRLLESLHGAPIG